MPSNNDPIYAVVARIDERLEEHIKELRDKDEKQDQRMAGHEKDCAVKHEKVLNALKTIQTDLKKGFERVEDKVKKNRTEISRFEKVWYWIGGAVVVSVIAMAVVTGIVDGDKLVDVVGSFR